MSLIIDYPWYFIIFCLLLGATYALALYFVRRGKRGAQPFSQRVTIVLALLRALSVAAIAFLLLSPLVKRETSSREKPIVVIAEDKSMSLNYCPDSAYYNGDFLSQMDALEKDLSADFDVRRYTFGPDVVAKDNDARTAFEAPSTDISKLLEDLSELYFHRNIGAMIVATDGIYNCGGNPVTAAHNLTFPVFTIAMGDTTQYADASIANVRFNRIAYLGNSFPLEITVNAMRLKGKQTTMSVSCEGRKLFSKTIVIDQDHFTVSENVTLTAEREGVHSYLVEISAIDGEKTVRNNRRTIPVEVIDGHQKVAIIAAAPHPDVAALRASLEKNQNYEVETMLASDFKGKVDDYSLLILHQLPSKVAEAGIDVAGMLKSGVPALFVLGGQSDLSRLNALHVGMEIFSRIDRQNEALAMPNKGFSFFAVDDDMLQRISNFPPLASPFGEYKLAGNAQILFNAKIGSVNSGMPLIAMTQMQDRRYSFVAGEGLWRWRLADWQQNNSHADFDELINKIVTFTALKVSKERLHVEAKRLFAQNEAVVMEAQIYNDNYEPVNTPEVELSVSGAEGESRRFSFNRSGNGYTLNIGVLNPGTYRYTATSRFNGENLATSGSFVVEEQNLEAMNTVADHAMLNTLATTTGGSMVEAHDCETLADMLRNRSDLKTILHSETRYSNMLNLPLIFIMIIVLLTAEWVIRKYNGEV